MLGGELSHSYWFYDYVSIHVYVERKTGFEPVTLSLARRGA